MNFLFLAQTYLCVPQSVHIVFVQCTALVNFFKYISFYVFCLICFLGPFSVINLVHLFQIGGRQYRGSLLVNLEWYLGTYMYSQFDCLVVLEFGNLSFCLKVPLREGGSLSYVQSYMNNAAWYLNKSSILRMFDFLNEGSVWLLYRLLLMTRMARFCSLIVGWRTALSAFPRARITCVHL